MVNISREDRLIQVDKVEVGLHGLALYYMDVYGVRVIPGGRGKMDR
jgi:hypothetical protein